MKRAVIVTGDRHATSDVWDYAIGYALTFLEEGDIVIHGAARGIDMLADGTAQALGLEPEPYPADWYPNGAGRLDRSAGPRRNTEMLRRLLELRMEGYDIEVLAFHDDLANSKGTGDMVRQARKAGVPVTVYHSDGSAA